MALTITDKIMRSDVTPHTAELHHFEAGDAWQVSWLPQRLMDRKGGACGAAGPASAPGSALGRPARRTPGRSRRAR